VVHGPDGVDGRLPLAEGDEGAAAALAAGVAQHRAVLDGAVGREEGAHVVLLAVARHHAHEQLALVAVLGVGGLHLDGVVHARERAQVVEGVLRVQRRRARRKGDEAAALGLARLLVAQHVQLVDAAVLFEQGRELGLAHVARYLAHEHFDGVQVGLWQRRRAAVHVRDAN